MVQPGLDDVDRFPPEEMIEVGKPLQGWSSGRHLKRNDGYALSLDPFADWAFVHHRDDNTPEAMTVHPADEIMEHLLRSAHVEFGNQMDDRYSMHATNKV